MWNRIMLTICSVFVLTGSALTGDMTHVPDRDFDTLRAAGNRNPTGIWSDGMTMWVADRSIFSGEIDNDWDCYTLDVWAGESYAVELTALNGTGYKGDCSYRDENTGEIRVTGENTETQVWRHRGGAGSKARIIVETAR